MKTRCALSLLGLGAGMGIAGAAYAQSHTYSVTDLGTLSNTPNNNGCGAQVTGINNQGQVVGSYFVDTQSYGGIARGFLWNNGKLSQVGAAYNPNQKLTIVAINNQGDMAGNISAGCYPGLGDYSIHQLFLGKHNEVTELELKIPTQNWLGAVLSDINDNDKLVGTLFGEPPTITIWPPAQAFTYSVKNNRLISLGFPAGYTTSYGAAINAFGTVAGSVGNNPRNIFGPPDTLDHGNTDRAAWWNGAWHILPCDSCAATGINFWSEIVGYSGSGGFVWNGSMIELAGFPAAVNDNGTIVGSAYDPITKSYYAVVWDNSPNHNLLRLDSLIDQHDPARGMVYLQQATAINSHGDIVADGCWTAGAKTAQCRPFLLTPEQAAVASR